MKVLSYPAHGDDFLLLTTPKGLDLMERIIAHPEEQSLQKELIAEHEQLLKALQELDWEQVKRRGFLVDPHMEPEDEEELHKWDPRLWGVEVSQEPLWGWEVEGILAFLEDWEWEIERIGYASPRHKQIWGELVQD